MTNDKLLTMFLENGLLQFGRFEREGQFVPILLNLELMPSYPETLRYIAEQVAEKIGAGFERIVCTADSLALGTAISLKTNIPLVYSRGLGELPVHDLVGAYDVGHPALLVMNVLQSPDDVQHFIDQAKKVGLHIQDTFALIKLTGDNVIGYNSQGMFTLKDIVQQLAQTGDLAKGQADTVIEWLLEKQES